MIPLSWKLTAALSPPSRLSSQKASRSPLLPPLCHFLPSRTPFRSQVRYQSETSVLNRSLPGLMRPFRCGYSVSARQAGGWRRSSGPLCEAGSVPHSAAADSWQKVPGIAVAWWLDWRRHGRCTVRIAPGNSRQWESPG